MNKLNADEFSWENYGLNQGENGWRVLNPNLSSIPCDGYRVLGYLDNNHIPDDIAVMFIRDEDSVKFWLRVNLVEFHLLDKSSNQ